jgi:midasin
MKDLQINRQGTGNVFGGKQGYITLRYTRNILLFITCTKITLRRDLFRWAERHPQNLEELAVEGYMLLAERLRRDQDKEVIRVCMK